MRTKKSNILSVFFITVFLLPITDCFAQRGSNGFLAIKVGANYFKDNEGRRLNNGELLDYGGHVIDKYIELNQLFDKSPLYPYGEISYYLERDNYFGFSLGIGYQFNKTHYTIKTYERFGNGTNSIKIEGNGYAGFKNHSFKMAFGLNFNTKFGLNIFLQPLNPEFRLIKNDKSNVEYKNYTVYTYKLPPGTPGGSKDSATVLNNVETKPFEFVNYKTHANFSLSFPTTIGVEQTLSVKGFNFMVGASASASFLEGYILYRAYIGIPFINKKQL